MEKLLKSGTMKKSNFVIENMLPKLINPPSPHSPPPKKKKEKKNKINKFFEIKTDPKNNATFVLIYCRR